MLVSGLLFLADTSLVAKTFNILDFGANGNSQTLDTAAIQSAIDAAATNGGMVLIPARKKFLVASLNLPGGIDFHLEGTLLISTNSADYSGEGVLQASNSSNLKIIGSGKMLG